jgi:hypothetical protein
MGGNHMQKIGWTVGALALALAALPALATTNDDMGATDTTAAEAEAEPAAPAATPESASGSVARASFTTLVVDREPQDEITSLPGGESEIVFFTEFSDMTGRTLTHVWEHGGSEMARVPFSVQGPRWRVYSTKQLQPGWEGEWTVSVVDEDGTVLRSESFEYGAAAESGPPATAAAAAEPAAAEASPAAPEPPVLEESATAPEPAPAPPAALE